MTVINISYDTDFLSDSTGEYLLLGALLFKLNSEESLFSELMDRLSESVFSLPDMKELYLKMNELYVLGKNVTFYEVSEQLQLDLYARLNEVKNEYFSSNALHSVIDHLIFKEQERKLVHELSLVFKTISSPLSYELQKEALKMLPDKVSSIVHGDLSENNEMIGMEKATIRALEERDKQLHYISTGINLLDKKISGGFKLGSVAVFGASPSTGKTIFGLKVLLEIQKNNNQKKALIFSLEATTLDVTSILITHYLNSEYNFLDNQKIIEELANISALNIDICDKGNVTTAFMRRKCKQASKNSELSVVLVDYLDLIKVPFASTRHDRDLEIITTDLKNIAKEFNCVVILLTQLNKDASKREDKRPKASDSKNTSSTEQVATYWFGLNQIGKWYPGENYPDQNIFELILDKGRYDTPFIIYFRKEGRIFYDINQDEAKLLIEAGNKERDGKNNKQLRPFKK